jgi:hypothetical protein
MCNEKQKCKLFVSSMRQCQSSRPNFLWFVSQMVAALISFIRSCIQTYYFSQSYKPIDEKRILIKVEKKRERLLLMKLN